jgi:hypothetical protein
MLLIAAKSRGLVKRWIAVLVVIAATTLPAVAGPQFAVALHGYDPVAYFTDAKPVLGDLRFTQFWNGANWIFHSEANRAKFVADPTAFAPQYDGYCAYAASLGYIAPGDPQVCRVVDGKLYLNFSVQAAELWEKGIPGNIAKANENWPRLNAH